MFKLINFSLKALIIILVSALLLIFSAFFYFSSGLPDYKKLSNYQPPISSRVYSENRKLIAEYALEKRLFIPFESIPDKVINAFLSAEDKNFFSHPGIDAKGILRAVIKNIKNISQNKRLEGASTITQQVAKNFLLTNEISYTRKIKEIIIALRMEKVLEKKQIMELYLNEIYLGNGSYGVAAASLNYFNKSLASLDLHEMAMLAALPKAPSTYNPYKNPIKAMKRRNWVLTRLFDEKFINLDTYTSVLNQKLVLSKSKKILNDNASFFKEEVRREIISKFNESKLYDGGLTIMTTLNEDLQLIAEESFRAGLKSYSFRNGWNGPLMNVSKKKDFFEKVKRPEGIYEDDLGLVVKVNDDHIKIVDKKKNEIKLFKNQMSLIKKKKTNLKKFFKVGDVIVFSFDKQLNSYKLSQIPKVNGGMVVIDNFTGRVLAMVGGYDSSSSFNRATQAKRQLGSSFKPFVYITALENGYTPISKVLDAPFVIDDLSKDGVWRPTNYGDKFYGLSTLRLGIEKSRNLMTIRLSDQIGLDKVSKISKKLGIYENFPLLISSSLGSLESSLIKITAGYASIANGGYRVEPRMIDVIYDKEGKIIFNGEKRKCLRCNINADDYSSLSQYELPIIKNNSDRIFSKESAYQMTSFLMGVIKRGTAKNINNFSYQIAGKTGTTNENQDAWFIGYNSEITVGVFVGYDEPKSLGKFETGSRVAAPIFRDFMNKSYIKTKPIPFNIPDSIKFINIDLFSGKPSNQNFITESFKYNFNFDDNIDLKVNESDNELKGFY